MNLIQISAEIQGLLSFIDLHKGGSDCKISIFNDSLLIILTRPRLISYQKRGHTKFDKKLPKLLDVSSEKQ